MSLQQVVSFIVLLQAVFGGRHEDFLSGGWTFIGAVNRWCDSELMCGGGIPTCDSSTNGKTVQDRIDVNNCVAQQCESGNQLSANTYYCASSRKEEFLRKGWSFIGNYDRWCDSELDCSGTIPYCDSSTFGKTVQDRNNINGCVAQQCESGTQWYRLTYYCEPIVPHYVSTTTAVQTTTTSTTDAAPSTSTSTVQPTKITSDATAWTATYKTTTLNDQKPLDIPHNGLETTQLVVIIICVVVVCAVLLLCAYFSGRNSKYKHKKCARDGKKASLSDMEGVGVTSRNVKLHMNVVMNPTAPTMDEGAVTSRNYDINSKPRAPFAPGYTEGSVLLS